MHGSIVPVTKQSPGQVQRFGSRASYLHKAILFRWQRVRRIENYVYLLLNRPTRGFFLGIWTGTLLDSKANTLRNEVVY